MNTMTLNPVAQKKYMIKRLVLRLVDNANIQFSRLVYPVTILTVTSSISQQSNKEFLSTLKLKLDFLQIQGKT